jgi:hypothetical protein
MCGGYSHLKRITAVRTQITLAQGGMVLWNVLAVETYNCCPYTDNTCTRRNGFMKPYRHMQPIVWVQHRMSRRVTLHYIRHTIPCRVLLIHTYRVVALPSSDIAVSFVKVLAYPEKSELPTVKPCVVVGRNRIWACRPSAVEKRSLLFHTFHAMPCFCRALCDLEKLLAERNGQSTAGTRHSTCEWNTFALCYSNGKDIIYIFSNTALQEHNMVCVISL